MKYTVAGLRTLLVLSIMFFTNSIHSGVNFVASATHPRPLTKCLRANPLLAAIERQFNNIERNIIEAAEAMPENKFDFTPESLNISGSDFKGVRSFAAQIKHLATDNFFIWTPLTDIPLRTDITDVNGPASLKSKADILKYLKDSFDLGRKAIASLTDKNAMDMVSFRGSQLAKLDLAFYALTHSNEHYGQMVVYLRMCGIIPPASRPPAQ